MGSELACRLPAAGFWPAAACLFVPASGATEVLVWTVGAFSSIKENKNRNNLGYDGDFKLSMAYMTVKSQIQNSIQMMTLLKRQRGKNPFCFTRLSGNVSQSDWCFWKRHSVSDRRAKIGIYTSFVSILWTAACLWGQRAFLPSPLWCSCDSLLWKMVTFSLIPWGKITHSVKLTGFMNVCVEWIWLTVSMWRIIRRPAGPVCIIITHFSKAFDNISHNIFLEKLSSCEMKKFTLHWVKNWLGSRAQRSKMNGASSVWKTVS